jgi:hypothetical protein
MQVAKYTFQSPYPSPVQVGRLDPSSLKDESTKNSSQDLNIPNETVQKAQTLQNSLKGDVRPTVTSNRLDVYA